MGISLGLCTVRKSILGSRLRVGTSSRLAETKRKKKVARGCETVSPHAALHYKEKKRESNAGRRGRDELADDRKRRKRISFVASATCRREMMAHR